MVRTRIARRSGWGQRVVLPALVMVALAANAIFPSFITAQDTTSSSLLGNFTVVISITDVQRDIPNGPSLYGRWQITFRADGTYGAERADLVGELITGIYEVEGDQVTVTDQGGILSCSNASVIGVLPDAAVGTYTWQRTDDRLSLTPVEDNCAGRRILFSTRQLTGFSPCATQPLQLNTAIGSASPVAEESATADASPVAEGSPTVAAPPAVGAPSERAPEASGSPTAANPDEAAIDELLSQMTSCWATGQPEYFLPLMTASFRAQFLQSSSGSDPISELATLMASTPFVWQRSGDVTMVDDTHATALVRQAVNNQEDFVRYAFALEDGQWRWNGAG